MSTKCINNATLEELGGNEFLTNVFWKMPINHHKLDDIEQDKGLQVTKYKFLKDRE